MTDSGFGWKGLAGYFLNIVFVILTNLKVRTSALAGSSGEINNIINPSVETP